MIPPSETLDVFVLIHPVQSRSSIEKHELWCRCKKARLKLERWKPKCYCWGLTTLAVRDGLPLVGCERWLFIRRQWETASHWTADGTNHLWRAPGLTRGWVNNNKSHSPEGQSRRDSWLTRDWTTEHCPNCPSCKLINVIFSWMSDVSS